MDIKENHKNMDIKIGKQFYIKSTISNMKCFLPIEMVPFSIEKMMNQWRPIEV